MALTPAVLAALDARDIATVLGDISGVTAVAVLRDDQVLIPRGPTILRGGDEIVLIANLDGESRVRAKTGECGEPAILGPAAKEGA